MRDKPLDCRFTQLQEYDKDRVRARIQLHKPCLYFFSDASNPLACYQAASDL